jgi:hypothetical protein
VPPIEVVAAARVLRRERHRAIGDRSECQARRAHQRLLRAGDDYVNTPFVLGQLNGAEARDRVHAEDRVVGAHDLVDRPDVVDDAGRRLGLRDVDGPRGTIELAQGLVKAPGIDLGPPLEFDVPGVRPEGVAQLGPALAELAARGDDRGSPARTRFETADSMAVR